MSAIDHWEFTFQDITGFDGTVFKPVWGAPAQLCTSGAWLPRQHANVAAEDQMADHIISNCFLHSPFCAIYGLTGLNKATIVWLQKACPEM